MKDKYLRETRMVDFSNPAIQKLIQNMKWKEMGEFERIKAIYNYVRDDVLFGYNIDDGISASKVLADGYGQCNTRGSDSVIVQISHFTFTDQCPRLIFRYINGECFKFIFGKIMKKICAVCSG